MECCDGPCRPFGSQVAAIMSCKASGEQFHICDPLADNNGADCYRSASSVATSRPTLTRLSRNPSPSAHDYTTSSIQGHQCHGMPGPVNPLVGQGEWHAEAANDGCMFIADAMKDQPDPRSMNAPHPLSVEKLRAFLHAPALDGGSSRFSARHIRHRYLSWKREGRLGHINSNDMTSLICLFGSLSVSSPTEHYTSLHGHRRLGDMPESSFDSHWDMVLGICSDKRWLRHPLSISDQYWLMRARLVRFQEHMEHSKMIPFIR